MIIKISYENPKPMYEQIEDAIKQAIYSGELKDNDSLPSVRQLSADLSVSQITTKRAYADLEREGFIYTVLGRGTFVRVKNLETIRESRQQEVLDEVKESVKKAYEAHAVRADIIKLVDEIYGG